MRNPGSGVLTVLFMLALVCFGGVLLVGWQFNRPPFPLTKLDQLDSRMNTNDVRSILGVPSGAYSWTNESGQPHVYWSYSRVSSWPIVYIYFSPDGTSESIDMIIDEQKLEKPGKLWLDVWEGNG